MDDKLGWSLAVGDFDGDGFDDLAIGSPYEDLGFGNVYEDTGSIAIAYGAADPSWFDLSRTDHLAQSTIYGVGTHEDVDDHFGWAFAAADFDGDGRDDLAIGHPRDDWFGEDLGAVTVLMGATPAIGASTRFRLLAVGWDGVPGNATQTGQFAGAALAAGDSDGDGLPDLAIGVVGYDHLGVEGAGAEAVLYGDSTLFSDGFEIGSLVRWSAKTP